MSPSLLDLDRALSELRSKPIEKIEKETALTWGARAAASYTLSLGEDDPSGGFRRFYEGENYRQESFGHASMADANGRTLSEIRAEVDTSRQKALKHLERVLMAS